jgi:hypothetical protein
LIFIFIPSSQEKDVAAALSKRVQESLWLVKKSAPNIIVIRILTGFLEILGKGLVV